MIMAWKDMEFVRKLGRKSKVKPRRHIEIDRLI